MDERQQRLAAMLAGKPTKESEAIRLINAKAENSKIPASALTERNHINELPSATDLNITKQEAMMGTAKALKPVSEDDLSYLFGENKGKPRPKPQYQPPQQAHDNYYNVPGVKQLVTEDRDKFDDIDMLAELEKLKGKKQPNTTQFKSSNNLINETFNVNELKSIVENIVYNILSEIIGEANDHLVNKEQIKIQIGESLFVGNLQQALVMPKKK